MVGAKEENVTIAIFVSAVAYAILMTSIVSNLVTERISGLKHL
jgi:hypothetical protein